MPTGLQRIFTLLGSLFFLSHSSVAQQAFVFEHPDCQVRIKKRLQDESYLEKRLQELLISRQFDVKYLIENKKLPAGDMYATLKVETPSGKLWKDCVVTVSLKRAKGQVASKSDPVLYTKEIKRALPRITFSGKERCKRALQDAFIHIPYCKKIGY